MPSPWAVSLLAAFPALISASAIRHEQQQQPLRQFAPIGTQDHSQNYEFDPLLHLPGTSPYFDAVGFGLEHKPPTGCSVTAASYLVRHGAIYANDAEYEKFIKPFLEKFEEHRGQFTDGLEWLNAWRSPIDEDMLEELTPSGANAAEKVGKHIGHRYEHFVNTTKRVLADKKSRCFDTAQNFIRKFPNTDPEQIEVIKLKKPKDGTIDPTLPHKTCNAFEKTPGDEAFKDFVEEYTKYTIARLETAIPSSLKLEPFDVVGMQSICGYESAITGSKSKFCAIFTDAEWMAYEYAWDMKYAYMVGPLNKLSPYLGLPWLKSQAEIFEDISANASTPGQGWPQDQRLFLYFTHREVPPFVATLLGIFESDDVLKNGKKQQSSWPTDRIVWTRSWKMSDLIPFLGHVGLEKLSCDATSGAIHPDEVAQGVEEKEFVRVIANTAPRPIPGCQKGPGASCPFDRFQHMIGKWDEKFGEYKKICKN